MADIAILWNSDYENKEHDFGKFDPTMQFMESIFLKSEGSEEMTSVVSSTEWKVPSLLLNIYVSCLSHNPPTAKK